jgi:hypothetical protein
MTVAAAQASKFYEQVVRDDRVFTLLDNGNFLVFPVGEIEVVPFWSSRSRLTAIQKDHQKYSRFEVDEMPFKDFWNKTLPQLAEEDIHVGVNWSGTRLVGYNLRVDDVKKNIEYWRRKLSADT